jgi:signal transduction histidine kinase/CheY-like chemotaxis protein
MEAASILVVDDEPGIALLCKRVLARAGYTVAALTEPQAAVSWLEKNHADLLLVDIRMPEVDGFEVITRVRQLQPDIAVLVMTGFGTVETAIRALRQGVDGLILKPFEQSEEMIEAVKLALADNLQKRDAARIQAIRPLFAVTESLLSETRREALLELIINAVRAQLRCGNAAYYQFLEPQGFVPIAVQGRTPDSGPSERASGLITRWEGGAVPLLLNASGPGEALLQEELIRLGFGSVMLVSVLRPDFRSALFAGRDPGEAPFSQADFEMFQILARQAAAAMENSRLYEDQRAYVRKVEESQHALLQAEKMAAAGRLSASIAHEVNNPLQSIQNCLHLAGREDLPPDKRKEYFELARTELDRLSVTVQRMLDFYRPGAAAPEEVMLPELLEYVLNLMSKQLAEREILVNSHLPGTLPPIRAVSSQIQQVFINLVLNSFDAMPEGGHLQITARRAGEGVEILFQDNGRGVAPDKRSGIFEPFFSTKDGGTGLGLTVSYNIITAHGGTLELLPDTGRGACFRVFLPTGGKQ